MVALLGNDSHPLLMTGANGGGGGNDHGGTSDGDLDKVGGCSDNVSDCDDVVVALTGPVATLMTAMNTTIALTTLAPAIAAVTASMMTSPMVAMAAAAAVTQGSETMLPKNRTAESAASFSKSKSSS